MSASTIEFNGPYQYGSHLNEASFGCLTEWLRSAWTAEERVRRATFAIERIEQWVDDCAGSFSMTEIEQMSRFRTYEMTPELVVYVAEIADEAYFFSVPLVRVDPDLYDDAA